MVLVKISCNSPFFPARPQTDRPIELVDPRNSPAGVINQLFKAYEYRNIGLYTSLLTSDFRFYVAQGIGSTKFEPKQDTMPDTFMTNVPRSNSFSYWEYDVEVKSTSNMFSQTIYIEVDQYFINEPEYHSDSLAEVMVTNLSLDILKDINEEYKIENQPQVFVLKRFEQNGSKIWLIWKWYDLGTEN